MSAWLRNILALVVGIVLGGAVFWCGGIGASFMMPAPKWFIALAPLLACIPMAWLAIQIGLRRWLRS